MTPHARCITRLPLRIAIALGTCAAMVAVLASAAPGDPAPSSETVTRPHIVVVLGAPGSDEYGEMFHNWAEGWRAAADPGGAEFTLIGGDESSDASTEPDADRARLQSFLAERAAQNHGDALWLVFIGHGTFDGDVAKINLRGPDVAVKQLAEWLAPIKTPVAVIDCTSASAPLINAASAPNRVVITATKSGFELNFARFGKYLAEAVTDPAADLDKDDQTSLLEAYLTACRGVAEFYESEQRLATEHALLDDNGDGLGTPADWFRGVRATQRAKAGAALDGLRAHQFHLVPSDRENGMPRAVRERRDALELSLAALRDKKAELGDEKYYQQLEPLLVELARLYAVTGDAPPAP